MDNDIPLEKRLQFEICNHDGAPESARLAEALGAEVALRFGPRDETPLTIAAKDETGALAGGLEGATHWRWLYVGRLWVAPAWRGRGLGRRLLLEAERQARERRCVGAYLDTFDERAAAFYECCGFARFGRLDDFPPGAARIFLRKRLDL
jgi:GNAT superfamily N-acetyltransferase